jgi:hypothetical protein
VAPGELVVLVDSAGHAAVAVNRGSAAAALDSPRSGRRHPIKIERRTRTLLVRVIAMDTPSMSRRRFLAVAGAAAGAVSLAGCGGFSTGGDEAASDPDTLRFTLWGSDPEVAAFKSLADAFKQRENVTVEINNIPFGEVRQNVDAGLQSGRAPDLFRVTYNDLGVYGSQGVLLELDQYLPAGYADAFTPALWRAVTVNGKVIGIPHHTDTSMLLYNKDAMAAAGVRDVPTSPDDAWTQEEFLDVARRIKGKAGTRYAFGVNWQQAGAYRWLNWVFQNGGRLLTPDLSAPCDRLRRRPRGAPAHAVLLHPGPGPAGHLDQGPVRRRDLPVPHHRDGLRRRLPAVRAGGHGEGLRVRRHVPAGRRAGRGRPSAATRWWRPRTPGTPRPRRSSCSSWPTSRAWPTSARRPTCCRPARRWPARSCRSRTGPT